MKLLQIHKIFIVCLCVALVLFGGMWYQFQNIVKTPNSGTEEAELLNIEKGSTVRDIAHALHRQDFIPSQWAFLWHAKREGIEEKFQAGRFYLPKNLTIPEVANKLLNGKGREEFFTIPEGLTLQEIDERIAKKGYAEKGSLLECIQEVCDFSEFLFLPKERTAWEGYFFPETYAVQPVNFSAELLAKKMLSEFEKRARKLKIFDAENLEEIIIMASLIEEESRKDEERPIISGILWKRLEEGIPLGVDATVRYFTGKKTEPLTIQDLEADNPYNTRKNLDLPPTAIAGPGEASLDAAANPEESENYYYLHDEDGQIHYARTNAEHNKNKRKYL